MTHPKFDPQALKAANARHLWHPMAHPQAMRDQPPDIIVRGEGSWIWDVDGHRLVDGVGGLWSANLGFGRREIRDAIVEQLDELAFYNIFRGTTHPRAIELAERLVTLMADDGVAAVVFSNGGSDAVEGALKIARQYWKCRGQRDRTKFIALRQGYHGVHFGGMSVNGNTNFRRAYEPLLPGCFHVDTPWLYRNPYSEDPEELARICAELLEREIVFQGPDTVAAFIAEPVQGAGGVIIPPDTYWPEIQRIVDRYGILLISDEVICAFGRLGHWFAYEKFGYKPDLVTFAKAVTSGYVPLGGVMVGDRVAQVLIDKGGEFNHGYTYSGHPVACAVALENIAIMERERLPEQVRGEIGRYFGRRFAELGEHPLVASAEACGFVAGLILVRDKKNKTLFDENAGVGMICRTHCFNHGVIMRAVGDRMIIAPPLVMTTGEIDEMIGLIRQALDLTLKDVQIQGLA